MFKDIFRKRSWPSQQQAVPAPIPNHLRVADREDDGFILVGQTEIERTAVGPDISLADFQDTPPAYWSLQQSAPPRWDSCFTSMGNSASQVPVQSSRPSIVVQPSAESINNVSTNNPGIADTQNCNGSSGNLQNDYRQYVASVNPMHSNHLIASTYSPARSPSRGSQRSMASVCSSNTIEFTTSSDTGVIKSVPFKLAASLDSEGRSQYNAYVGLIKKPDLYQYDYDFELERSVSRSTTH